MINYCKSKTPTLCPNKPEGKLNIKRNQSTCSQF